MTLTRFAVLALAATITCDVAALNTSDSSILKTVVEGVQMRIDIRFAELQEHLADIRNNVDEMIKIKKSEVHEAIRKVTRNAQSQGENVVVCSKTSRSKIYSSVSTAQQELQTCYNSSIEEAERIVNETRVKLENCHCDDHSCVAEFGKEITEIAFEALKVLKRIIMSLFKCPDGVVQELFRELNEIQNGVEVCVRNILGVEWTTSTPETGTYGYA